VPPPSCRRSLCSGWYEGALCWLPVVPRVVRRLVVLEARSVKRATSGAWFRLKSVVPGVLPEGCGSDRTPVVPVWYQDGVVGACGQHPNERDRSAEHADAADRCARKIVRILTLLLARSRRLIGKPFGVRGASVSSLF